MAQHKGIDVLESTLEDTPDHGLFVVKHEKWQLSGDESGMPSTEMRVAYTPDGNYVGDPDGGIAKAIVEREIHPELIDSEHRVCSIGYSNKTDKWYGWSHRAIAPFDTRERAIKFAKSVASVETAAIPLGTHVQINLAVPTAKAIALTLQNNGIVPNFPNSMHATIFDTCLPNFQVRPSNLHIDVPLSKCKLDFFGPGKMLLCLLLPADFAKAKHDALVKAEKNFGEKTGLVYKQMLFSPHMVIAEVKNDAKHKINLDDLFTQIKSNVTVLDFDRERITGLKLQERFVPYRKVQENSPEANRRRLEKGSKAMANENYFTINQRRKIEDPLVVPQEELQSKLDDLYSRRKVAALSGNGRQVATLSTRIRVLRAANGLEEDITTRPQYVAHDSNIDPRGGLLVERAAVRGHSKIQALLMSVTPDEEIERSLNVIFDLNWTKAKTLASLSTAYKLFAKFGYVVRAIPQGNGISSYEFSTPDKVDVWSFTLASTRDWCFDVRHNGEVLAQTFAGKSTLGIPDCMLKDGWEGVISHSDAHTYQMAWRSVLATIRSYLEKSTGKKA